MTTDASGRWSSEWVRDGIFAPIWDRATSGMTPQTAVATERFAVALGYRAARITVNLTDYSENGSGSSGPLDALVTAPDGTRFDAILTEQAAGELSGSFEAPKPGDRQYRSQSAARPHRLHLPPARLQRDTGR